ncbi:hypothetical protein JCM10908_004770 [Rhodotorula pacifica]|uniref:uncharacterized protein n=1 Tax=Rhodotorula pacifica TaxID=1495444 RepID=UPI00316DCE64
MSRSPLHLLIATTSKPRMDDSWRFDGSIVSLSESIGPHSASTRTEIDPSLASGSASARSQHDNDGASLALATAEASATPTVAFSAAIADAAPLMNASTSQHEPSQGRSPTSTDLVDSVIIDPLAPRPPAQQQRDAPPLSPTDSTASSAASPPQGQRGRERTPARTRAGHTMSATATRSTSVSSITSTDGSAVSSTSYSESGDAGTTSDAAAAGGGSAFVMPSLNLGGATARHHSQTHARSSTMTTDHSSSEPEAEADGDSFPRSAAAAVHQSRRSGEMQARILVLGLTVDDRRTFAKLVSLADGKDTAAAAAAREEEETEDRRRRTRSSASLAGETDMSFSFLSEPPTSSSSRHSSHSPAQPINNNNSSAARAFFEALSPSAGSATLFHLTADDDETSHKSSTLLNKLQIPFERLEAKISRAYPATDGLAKLVAGGAGCGAFDACLFLFSSPPTAREIALARPVSRLLPLFPVLLLPPPPPGKSQKTYALCHAVQEQLNGADVRWLPAISLERRGRADCGQRPAAGEGGGGGGPLFMLPHDLFIQHPPPLIDPSSLGTPFSPSSGISPSFSSSAGPSSSSHRDSSTSLSSSQELFALPPTPHSPAFTAMSSAMSALFDGGTEEGAAAQRRQHELEGGARSLSASGPPSTRAGSSASRSDSRRRTQRHRRYASSTGGGGSSSESDSAASDNRHMYGSSTSLVDLKRLQAILHGPNLLADLRHLAALVFLEWREVEIAAAAAGASCSGGGSSGRASSSERRTELPAEWEETLLERETEDGHSCEASAGRANTLRKGLAFSRRVAERRIALAAAGSKLPSISVDNSPSAATAEEVGAPITSSTTRDSVATSSSAYWTDPTTPRCVQRGLPSDSSGSGGSDRLSGAEGYFPPSAAVAGVPWLSSSETDDTAAVGSSQRVAAATASAGAATPAGPLYSSSALVYLSPADPFHLPSLLHLVGLNLRLAFNPAAAFVRPASSSTSMDAEKPWSWWRAAATVGLVFAAGVAIGAQVISRRALLFGPSPTLAAAAAAASTADWAAWAPTVVIRA